MLISFLNANSQTIGNVTIDNSPSCPGSTDGNITVNINQTNPVSYVESYLYWQNPNFGIYVQLASSFGSNNQFFFSGLFAGNFRIDLKDSLSNNILDQAFVTISDPTQITTTISLNDISCNGLSDGSIDLQLLVALVIILISGLAQVGMPLHLKILVFCHQEHTM